MCCCWQRSNIIAEMEDQDSGRLISDIIFLLNPPLPAWSELTDLQIPYKLFVSSSDFYITFHLCLMCQFTCLTRIPWEKSLCFVYYYITYINTASQPVKYKVRCKVKVKNWRENLPFPNHVFLSKVIHCMYLRFMRIQRFNFKALIQDVHYLMG